MAVPKGAIAQDHVVSSSEVAKDLQAAADHRKEQVAKVDGFLGTSEAKKALAEAHIDYQQVHAAVQSLSDEDLARIAARADQAQKDFAAGDLSDRDLLIILVAVALLILIIVAVR
jgi:malic enzyme